MRAESAERMSRKSLLKDALFQDRGACNFKKYH